MSTKSASMRKPKRKQPQPISMLIEDHRRIEKMFDRFSNGDEDEKDDICQQVCMRLIVHEAIEEEIFFPAARDVLDDASPIDEAAAEYEVARSLITQLQDGDFEPDYRDSLFETLAELVRRHIEDEEAELFKQVRNSDMDFEEVAEEMAARKEELEADLGLPEDEDDNDDREKREEPRTLTH